MGTCVPRGGAGYTFLLAVTGESCCVETHTGHPQEVPDVLLGVSKMWWKNVCIYTWTHMNAHTCSHMHPHMCTHTQQPALSPSHGAWKRTETEQWGHLFPEREIYEWEK